MSEEFDSIKDVAQAFADKMGVRVFPFKVNESGKKHPLVAGGAKSASRKTSDFRQSIWDRADGYGVVPDGYTVIDIDAPEARRVFAEEIAQRESIDTMIVDTPGKEGQGRGIHIWFRGETLSTDGLWPHIDLRSGGSEGKENQWIVGPGSVNPQRGGARWEAREGSWEAAPIPARMADVIRSKFGVKPSRTFDRDGERLTWEELLGRGRNVALTSVKGTLMRGGIPEDEANEAARGVNRAIAEEFGGPLSEAELSETVLQAKQWEMGELRAEALNAHDFEAISIAELMQRDEPSFIISEMFPEGHVSVMYGRPGEYKSFIALDWGARIAAGLDFPNVPGYQEHVGPTARTLNPRPVLYVAGEGVAGLKRRVRATADELQASPIRFHPGAVDLRNKAHVEMLAEVLYTGDYGLVIYDTLRKMTPGADENTVKEMGEMISNLEWIAQETAGCSALLVHHANRVNATGEPLFRGSSAIHGDADNMWAVWRDEPLRAKIKATKFKEAEEHEWDVQLRLREGVDSLYVESYALNRPDHDDAPPAQNVEQVISLLTGGVVRSRLAEHSDLSQAELDRAFQWATQHRNLRNTGGRQHPVWEAD